MSPLKDNKRIKKRDKSNTIIKIDKQQYTTEAERQLKFKHYMQLIKPLLCMSIAFNLSHASYLFISPSLSFKRIKCFISVLFNGVYIYFSHIVRFIQCFVLLNQSPYYSRGYQKTKDFSISDGSVAAKYLTDIIVASND